MKSRKEIFGKNLMLVISECEMQETCPKDNCYECWWAIDDAEMLTDLEMEV